MKQVSHKETNGSNSYEARAFGRSGEGAMKLGKFRKGQMAVVMTLAIATLLGVMALGTDVGVMYYQHLLLQKGADAAALAGANYLNESLTGEAFASMNVNANCTGMPDDAQKAACTYAMNNNLQNASLTYNETAASATPNTPNIQVVASQSGLPYMFGRVIGLSTYNVAAAATAYQGSTSATNGMFPMGIQCTAPCSTINLNPGATAQFGIKFTPTFTAGGNWQWITGSGGNGGGSQAVGTAITSGMTGTYSIGEDIVPKPGSDSQGPVVAAFNARFSTSSCPSITDPCTNPAGTVPPNDPCMVTVPAVDFNANGGVTGSQPMPIEAFAQVYIEPGSTLGNGKSGNNIAACFIQQVDPNAVASGGPALGSLGRPVLVE
jgi:Flp pilus assembly protein TadG